MVDLISFHGSQEIKDKYVERVKLHAIQDEIIKGTYWENGKGCAVGCTVHSGNHSYYEKELGIPRIIARLEDKIFEGLPNQIAKEFPLKFLEAVPVGKNLDSVWRKFLIWLLIDKNDGVIKYAKTDQTKDSISNVAMLMTRSLLEKITEKEFQDVKETSRDATADAAAAAHAAAHAAVHAAHAAHAAAYADVHAAAAYDAADAAYADADARYRHHEKMADKLIELLKEA